MTDLDLLSINTIRFLAADAVEKANSGHPGLPLGAAPMAYTLWTRHLRFNPHDPEWFDRDRFILSAGHGSMLLYALLHLTGYDLPLEQIERFRQWGSVTAGHPERGLAPGIEATTGPLGQGFGNGVGMAIAERFLAERYNRPDHVVIDHHTYAIVSDGDLEEGVASEAASLAGHLGLGKLIYLYDDNHISIEGDTGIAFTEDVGARFLAYGWHVQAVEDGNDVDAIDAAIAAARAETARPSLIRVRTHIGYGSPKQDTGAAHGEPLGEDALRATKDKLGWPQAPRFLVPDEVRASMGEAVARGDEMESEWRRRMEAYAAAFPDAGEELRRAIARELPPGWDADLPRFEGDAKPIATRSASGKVINALAKRVPNLIGGSADLAPSTKTLIDGGGDFDDGAGGRNLHFGVREHAMGAAVNGMAVHGGVYPYGATFLIFSDYMRPSIRLAALMRASSIFVFTHDSIGLGEDGPTHQPIEQLMSLRLIPGLTLIRPADANETAAAWRVALQRRGPVAFALTRQNLPILGPVGHSIADGVPRGAYVLREAEGGPARVVLLATGSEVHLALAAADALADRDVRARVVSMPSWELFDEQDAAYRDEVLGDAPRLAIEAGRTLGWERWVGDAGAVVGIDRFGESAPGKVVMEKMGFTVDHVVERALSLIAGG